jgi:hypothetical protein
LKVVKQSSSSTTLPSRPAPSAGLWRANQRRKWRKWSGGRLRRRSMPPSVSISQRTSRRFCSQLTSGAISEPRRLSE